MYIIKQRGIKSFNIRHLRHTKKMNMINILFVLMLIPKSTFSGMKNESVSSYSYKDKN
jgi:hypothetical protein